jgi:acyl-CoA synthetase (AMP-forming)/AMP-acid ligase II
MAVVRKLTVSRTTGLPKGVELTHYNLISNVEHLAFKRAKFGDNELAQHRRLVLPDSGERWLAALPMYHAFGQTYYTMLAPRIGAKIFIMEKFDPVQFLAYIDMYRITFINIVPAILRTLVKIPRPDRFNLKSVVMVGSGASPLDTAVARQFERLFLHPHVQIKQGWGMTETTCNVTGFAPDDVDDGRSIGWLNPGCAAIIVPVPDRDFSSLEREHQTSVGEIWVAGPNIMKGYWKNERATEDTIVEQDGYRWLRTGDVGFFDKRKCLYIVDRVKVSPNPALSNLALVCTNLRHHFRTSSRSTGSRCHQQS